MTRTECHDDHVVRPNLLAAAAWRLIGMFIGLHAAAALA